ncbi:MAG: hypothetical protein HC822_19615 [Oscillochloris sp.]|nr:hypothetical protein [Oscillochloris sp.]
MTWYGNEPNLDWCYLGERGFQEPFFDQTIRAHLQNPLNHQLRRTGISELLSLAQARPMLPLSGMIFHMSRCGSTLITRVLAADPTNLVIAEAPPIDEVLDTGRRSIHDDIRAQWLHAMITAIGQPRSGHERRMFLKFDSWHIHDLPLIRQVFPEVPWIFVYREPIEVIVSHQRLRGMQMAPGQIAPERLGLEASAAQVPFDLDRFCAQVIGNFCRSAAHYVDQFGGKPINYRDYPDTIWRDILPLFAVHPTAEIRELMELELQYHAKHPGHPFAPDSAGKRHAASPAQHQLAAEFAQQPYAQLEEQRLRHSIYR